jgi:diguanylate cyclase (GGDEF)-like protein/PAS domain S-box-containing protein
LSDAWSEERPGAPVEHKAFRYRKLSATHERLTGLSSDGVRGKTPAEVVGPEQGAELVARYQNCVNLRHPTSYEETLDLPSGRRVWHTQLTPIIRGDTVVQIVGSARDITERKEMEENLRYLSEVDSLTGVPNRRKTTEELDRELARAQRHGHPLSILLADIDHFKAVNDELGHETGDTALRGVAATIQATLRPTDRVGRWGGEEFVVVLPETDRAGARTAAERIRQGVENSQAVPGRTVTVSIGIAALGPIRSANPRALSHTVDSLVRIADEELYRAKERGRNCCSG